MTTEAEYTGLYLTGHVLLAMPSMTDPRFEKAVIFMVEHDDKGAMGIVINQPIYGLRLGQMFQQLSIDHVGSAPIDLEVLQGGPVETQRGFILHSMDFFQKETMKVGDHFGVTGTLEGLNAIAQGDAPRQMLFALGYSGWGAGQLEEEMRDNAWLTLPADADLLFSVSPEKKWETAIGMLGVNPVMLSSAAGTA
jgi:putative transcriptional regulator